MENSSEDEGEQGEEKNADDLKNFACGSRSDGAKNGSRKGSSSNKPSLRAQLSDALSVRISHVCCLALSFSA